MTRWDELGLDAIPGWNNLTSTVRRAVAHPDEHTEADRIDAILDAAYAYANQYVAYQATATAIHHAEAAAHLAELAAAVYKPAKKNRYRRAS